MKWFRTRKSPAVDRRDYCSLPDDAQVELRCLTKRETLDEPMLLDIVGGRLWLVNAVAVKPGAKVAARLIASVWPHPILLLGVVKWCEPSQHRDGGYDVGLAVHWLGWDSDGVQRLFGDLLVARLSEPSEGVVASQAPRDTAQTSEWIRSVGEVLGLKPGPVLPLD